MEEKKLAVIVPIYNVQDYLKDCLNSLLKQGVRERELQIILVDDGSTDNSTQVAQKFVEKYPDLFELHQFENAGLGAARNRGTSLAHAKFITYVDSDDIIPDGSYRHMLDIIESTGSDIITGNVQRFNSKKRWASFLHKNSITGEYRHTNLEKHPELIWDASSWNKIFRLDFLIRNNLYFPEDVLYEDFPMINPAFAAASGIDVTQKIIYFWRVREGSITQSSTDAKAVIDRITVTQIALEGLKKFNASDEAIEVLLLKSLNMGIIEMLKKEQYENVSNFSKEKLFKKLKDYLCDIPSDTFKKVKFDKVVYFDKVIKVKTQKEFDEITSKYLKNEINFSGYWNNTGQYVLKSDFSSLEKIATSDDLEIHPKVEEVVFEDDLLKIQGYFYAKYSDMSAPEKVKILRISTLSDDGKISIDIVGEKRIFENQRITAKFGYNLNHFVKNGADFNYDYSGYELKIPLSHLDFETANSLSLEMEIEVDGIKFEIPIKNPIAGGKTRPKSEISNARVFSISYTKDWSLVLSLKDRNVDELYFTEDGKELRLKGNANRIALKSGKITLPLKLVGGRVMISQTIQERIKSFDKSVFRWWQFITYINGKEKPIYYSGSPKNFQNDSNLEILFSNNGVATLGLSYLYPLIENIKVKDDILKLSFSLKGWMSEAKKVQVIADPTLSISWETEKINENLYQLSLPLTLDGFSDKEWLNFHVRLTFIDGYQTEELLRWGQKDFELKNEWISANGIGWFFRSVEKVKHEGFALLRSSDQLSKTMKVGVFDEFLQSNYQKWLKEDILDDVVVWSAYWGRGNKFGGNPRALYDYVVEHYPNLKHVIVIKNAIRSYPEYKNTKVVSFGTKDYWYYLAKAKYFVNDVNFTESQRQKRKEQVEVQTMHGTPLKTLGFDVLDEWKDSTYNSYHRRFKNYDYLVVPSDWVANYAKEAFRVSPKLLTTGYPRNDVFFNEFSLSEINNCKKKLKISLDKEIILYTPTWRQKDNKNATNISKLLDIDSLYQSLSDDTLLIIKNHPFEKLNGISSKYSNKIIFAPDDIQIEELYVVSDAVITDYSSVMFDYCLLNKPMIFWAPDYEEYVENRGINFDLSTEAPGPFISVQKDLEDWVRHLEEIPIEFKDKISQFKKKFAQYDRGNASEQISKVIWGEMG